MSEFMPLLLVLAVFRVSYMVAKEEGPFSLFSNLREKIDPYQKTWVGRGLNCPMCVSFWAGILGAGLWLAGVFNNPFGVAVLLALGASAVTVIIMLLSK